MLHGMKISLVAALFATTLAFAMPARAGSTAPVPTLGIGGLPSPVPLFNPGRSNLNDAQVRAIYQTQLEVYAIQRTLSMRLLNTSAIADARRDVRDAYRHYSAVRDMALVPLRTSEFYQSLQGQLWKGDTVVTTLHGYIPPDLQKIYERSVDNLSLRKTITQLEIQVLNSDEQVLVARVQLTAALQQYLAVLKDAADAVRNDPQMVDASMRLKNLRGRGVGAASAR
jgi:hypothetical protein